MEDLRAAPVDRFVAAPADQLAGAALDWGGPQAALEWAGQDRQAIRWDGPPAHLIGLHEIPPEGLPDLPPSEDEDWSASDQARWEAGRPLGDWSSMESGEE